MLILWLHVLQTTPLFNLLEGVVGMFFFEDRSFIHGIKWGF